jgi:AraC-like DNA-binding protein
VSGESEAMRVTPPAESWCHLAMPATPALRRWVGELWAGGPGTGVCVGSGTRERVLPTGYMHLVIRLAGPSLRLFDSACDTTGRPLGHCIVGGARDEAYLRAVDPGASSVGVMLRPGAAAALFGASAGGLAGTHWRLEDFWGGDPARLRERLIEAGDARLQLRILERELVRRLRDARDVHPAVALGLARLPVGVSVGTVVRDTGLSHRRFIRLFRDSVGLSPKAWARVLRVRRAVKALAAGLTPAAAAAAEYSDQAHFGREFVRISGLTPAQYRRIDPPHPNHVPIEH